MEPQKRIINEPVSQIREAARSGMGGHISLLIVSAVLYSLCLNLPVLFLGQITGFLNSYERLTAEFMKAFSNPSGIAADDLAPADLSLTPYIAVFLFLLLVSGPLELGISTIWLRVLRDKEVYADMIFSGFENSIRAISLYLIRYIFTLLWSLLLLIPGIIAYYRYSLAFFLLADNPSMPPLTALTYSKYYMQGNKLSRFVLDLSFIGWLALSYLIYYLLSMAITGALESSVSDLSFFSQYLISLLLNSVIFAPVLAYRGVASAEYYHRVICRDPKSFTDVQKLPG